MYLIDCGEAGVEVLVHPRFGEVEAGFFVFLIAGEFLADAVGLAVLLTSGSISSISTNLLAE